MSRVPARWVGLQSKTASFSRWHRTKFDVFITVDRNLSFQQNPQAVGIAIIVLQARTNRLADLLPQVPELLTAVALAERGIVQIVGK
jgi:Tfp pilus assembly ATPase PilU